MAKILITEENLHWTPTVVNRKYIFRYGILREVLFFKEDGEKFSIIVTFGNLGYHLSESGGFRFKGSFSSFTKARKSIENFIKTDLNHSYLNLPDVDFFDCFNLSKLHKTDGVVSLFADFFNKQISFPKGLKLKLCNIVFEKTFDEWLENYRKFQSYLSRNKQLLKEKPVIPKGIHSTLISNPEDAKQKMIRLGFLEIFIEIADGIIPKGLVANKVDRFYANLPKLLETFPTVENYLPLWEVNGESVVAFDLKRGGYFEFSFVSGKEESKIADSYQEFVTDLLCRSEKTGCETADIENLAAQFHFSRLREFQAFLERRKSASVNLPRFTEYFSERQTNPEEFLREEIKAFQAVLPDTEYALSPKCEILQNLEADFGNPIVLEFLLKVVEDRKEDLFARIEALTILQVQNEPTTERKVFIGKRLAKIIRTDSNDEIRNWASIAARNYVHEPEVLAAFLKILTNPNAGKCARYYCLSAIEFLDPTPQIVGILESLIGDKKIGWAVPKVLEVLAGWAKRKGE